MNARDRFTLTSEPRLIDGLWRCYWQGSRRVPFGAEYKSWREAHDVAERVRQEWNLE